MQNQLIRRVCDFCGEKQDFPIGGITPALALQMQSWITIAREYIVQEQPFPVVKHACKDSCAANILSTGMLALPENVRLAQQQEKVVPMPRPTGGTA